MKRAPTTLIGYQQITVHSLGLRLRAFEKIYKGTVDHVQSEGAGGRRGEWGVGVQKKNLARITNTEEIE